MLGRSIWKRLSGRRASLWLTTLAVLCLVLWSFKPVSAYFFSAKLKNAIVASLPSDVSLSMSDGELSLSGGGAVVDIYEVQVQKNGRFSAFTDHLRAVVDMQSILAGQFRPSRIEVKNLRLKLDGTAMSGLGERKAGQIATGTKPPLSSLEYAHRTAWTAVQSIIGSGVEEILIGNIRLDGVRGLTPQSREMARTGLSEFSWCRTCGDGNTARMRFSIKNNFSPSSASVEVRMPSGEGVAVTEVGGLPVAAVAKMVGLPEKEFDTALSGNLRMETRIARDGGFKTAQLRLNIGPGDFALNGKTAIRVRKASASAKIDSGRNRISFDRISLQTAETEIIARAEISPGPDGRKVQFLADFGGSMLAGPDGRKTIELKSALLKGTFEPASGKVVFASGSAETEAGKVRFAWRFAPAGPDPGLKGELQTDGADAAMIYALWPTMVAAEARDWFRKNVKSARIGSGALRFNVPLVNLRAGTEELPLPADGITGSITIRSAEFSPLGDMPSVAKASGAIRFRNATLDAVLKSGEISYSAFGLAVLEYARFQIPELGKPNGIAYLDFALSGPVSVIADLSNAGRLDIASSRDIDPGTLSGNAGLKVFAQLPLAGDAERFGVEAEFDLLLTEFAAKGGLTGGRLMTGGAFKLSGSLSGYTLSGRARLDGVPVDVRATSGDGQEFRTIHVLLDADARKALGLSLDPYLRGPVIAEIRAGRLSSERIAVDLSPADIRIPAAGWHKPAGQPAAFKADLVRSEGGTKVTDFKFFGEDFEIVGDLEVDRKGRLAGLVARRVRLNPKDDYSLTVNRTEGAWALAVSGRSLDARGLISALGNSGAGTGSLPGTFAVDMRFDHVLGHNDVAMNDVSGTAHISDGDVQALDIEVGAGTDGYVDLSQGTDAKRRQLTISHRNAGDLLRFLGIYKTLFGGSFSFTMSDQEDQQRLGQVSISNFQVQQSGRNLGVSRLTVPFSHRDSSVQIAKARMRADGLNATARGTIDLDEQRISIRGTIVPTNGLNQLPAAIPVIGDVLGARQRNGLIGIAFTLAGPLSAPHLQLNAASAVTPGIVRRIFNPGN